MTPPVDPKANYLAEFRAFAANGARHGPAWVRELREAAIARFAEVGFPSSREEAWRFTNIAPIAETRFATVAPDALPLPAPGSVAPLLVGEATWPRLVVANGRYAPELSSTARLPRGVTAGSLASALEEHGDLVRAHLARHARYDRNGFTALSTAFLQDGLFVHVAAGAAIPTPIEILFLVAGGDRPVVSYPRTLVVAEAGASLTVIEGYAALGEGSYLSNAVTELVVGDGARVGYYRLQREGLGAYHVATTHTHQGRDSVLSACAMAFGARLARHDLNSVLDGAGADCTLNGLYILRDAQHVDHHMLVEHAQPHGTSHELFNGILDDHARAVFNGKIHVHHGAQRTDAKQVNNNLLLTDTARADSQPQLEIYADDVKCTHGSTLGPLEAKSLFYLQSRGLDREAARSLLTYGFAADIVTRILEEPVRTRLDRLVRHRLSQEARALAP